MIPLRHQFMGPGERVSEHLSANECKCHCYRCAKLGVWQVVTPETAELFERIRGRCTDYRKKNCPIHINSGVRCPEHNADLEGEGAAQDSQHVVGRALDLKCPEGVPLWMFHMICDVENPMAGVGYYRWGCHVDTRTIPKGRTQPYRWGRKAKCPGN